MKDYIKGENIEYRIFSDGLVCKKTSVFARFPYGVLVYIENTDSITVYCRILCDFQDTNKAIDEIEQISLPKVKEQYRYMCIEPSKTANVSVRVIGTAITVLNLIKVGSIPSLFFKKKSATEEINTVSLIISAHKDQISSIEQSYKLEYLPQDKSIPILSTGLSMPPDAVPQIRQWTANTSFKDFCKKIEQRVIGQENLSLVLINIYIYLRNVAAGRAMNKNNIIITGPSGSGKTETYRALKEYFKVEIPGLVVSIRDTNQITSEGYKGHDTDYIVDEIKRGFSTGIGIVFLDELDKRLLPDHDSTGENVNSAIQAQLLTAIEGCILSGVDTSKTMFIGVGSFDSVRESRTNKKSFGFGSETSVKNERFYSEISREEMIEMGALYEFIGRFTSIIPYNALSAEDINRIIELRVEEISNEISVPISISDSMRTFLHENSNTPFGNRLIDSLIRETVNMALVDIYTNDIFEPEIVITGKGKYLIKQEELKLAL